MQENGFDAVAEASRRDLLDDVSRTVLERQGYKIIGRHSAVKICTWTRKSLLGRGFCYKQKFYGIESHRCLQMTPAVSWCTHRCLFCWRNVEHTLGSELSVYDDPEEIIDAAVAAQRILLTGYGGLVGKINPQRYEEARNPNQAAISLSGEPMVYPDINGLLSGFKRRGFSTFLVTNGTFPERLASLEVLPTQIYLSINAPDKLTYIRLCNPQDPCYWDKVQESIDLFNTLATRRVLRLTLVKGFNMHSVEGYADIIDRAEPDFVEVKAYMFVGGSRKRLGLDNMPSFSEVWGFAGALSDASGYPVKDFKRDSRVVMLSR